MCESHVHQVKPKLACLHYPFHTGKTFSRTSKSILPYYVLLKCRARVPLGLRSSGESWYRFL